MASKPLQRSLEELRERGYICAITERWNSFAKIRQDLFGCIDALAVNDQETLGINACADNGGDVSAHSKKFMSNPKVVAFLEVWLSDPTRTFEIWGWGLRGERGKRKVWTLRAVPIRSADVQAAKNALPKAPSEPEGLAPVQSQSTPA